MWANPTKVQTKEYTKLRMHTLYSCFVLRQDNSYQFYGYLDKFMKIKSPNLFFPINFLKVIVASLFSRYLYYFLKREGSDEQELCSVLEGLLEVDPTSDLSDEYTKLRMHQTRKWKSPIAHSAK